MLQEIIRKIQEFFNWIGELYQYSPLLYWVVLILCCLILAAIFTHAGVVMARAFRAARRSGAGPRAARDRTSPSKLLEEARRAAAAGETARALTLYLRAAILGLDLRGLVRTTETATVREYLGLLGRCPSERGLFERFLLHYEPGVFGRRRLEPASWQECDGITRRLSGERV
jgi:uncharacterized MAPEG superfamily protein